MQPLLVQVHKMAVHLDFFDSLLDVLLILRRFVHPLAKWTFFNILSDSFPKPFLWGIWGIVRIVLKILLQVHEMAVHFNLLDSLLDMLVLIARHLVAHCLLSPSFDNTTPSEVLEFKILLQILELQELTF